MQLQVKPEQEIKESCPGAVATGTIPAMNRYFRGSAFALYFLIGGAVSPACGQSDKDFIVARTAFERGDRIRLEAIAPKLAGHSLAPMSSSGS